MLITLQLIFYVVAILSGLLSIYAIWLNYVTNKLNKQPKRSYNSKKKYSSPKKKKGF